MKKYLNPIFYGFGAQNLLKCVLSFLIILNFVFFHSGFSATTPIRWGKDSGDPTKDFSEAFYKRYEDISLAQNITIGSEIKIQSISDPTEFLKSYQQPIEGSFEENVVDGLKGKNVATMQAHCFLNNGQVMTFVFEGIHFISGGINASKIKDWPLYRISPTVKVFFNDASPVEIVSSSEHKFLEQNFRQVKDRYCYFSDSEIDDIEMLKNLLNIVLDNLDIYSRGLRHTIKDSTGVDVQLEGPALILSITNALLEHHPQKDSLFFEKTREKLQRISKERRIVPMNFGTSDSALKVANDIISLLFFHAEQAAFEFFINNSLHIRKFIKACFPDTNLKEVNYVIDIMTKLDMCQNCYKTMFLRAYDGPYAIRIIGRRPFPSASKPLSRKDLVTLGRIERFSFLDYNKLYIKASID